MSGISIVMPARNAAQTIDEAIQSVLAQPLVREVVVIDDHSTDGMVQVVREIKDDRIVIAPALSRGFSAALNQGFEMATSEYIAQCDADDFYPHNRLSWQMAWLQDHEDFIAISGGFQTTDQHGKPVADLACEGQGRDITESLLNGKDVTSFCTWLTRAEILQQIGGVRPWFVTGSDIDLQFRLAQFGKIWHEPRISYFYRLHDNSITHQQNTEIREFYSAYAIDFAKQRVEHGHDDLEQGSPPSLPQPTNGKRNTANEHIISHLVGAAWDHHKQGNKRASIQKMLAALKINPLSLSLWKGLAALIVKS